MRLVKNTRIKCSRVVNILVFLTATFGVSLAQSSHDIVVSTDFEGNVVEGSIDTLISEIRKGKPVRVGFQLDFNGDKKPDFDHWIDAEYITILNGQVFTQIESIFRQIPRFDIPQIDIIPVDDKWTGIVGTNSKLLNRFVLGPIEFETDENGQPIVTKDIEKALKQREVRTWMVATFWSVPK